MDERTADKFLLWGWILFIVSALFFIWTSLRSADVIGLLGGIFFLVACIVFLIPLIAKMRAS